MIVEEIHINDNAVFFSEHTVDELKRGIYVIDDDVFEYTLREKGVVNDPHDIEKYQPALFATGSYISGSKKVMFPRIRRAKPKK
jgi:hypothetical protein